jgi:N-acyl-D-aspartate/D-glutamate deacylase
LTESTTRLTICRPDYSYDSETLLFHRRRLAFVRNGELNSACRWHKRASDQVDILILHGKLVDGSGRKARKADVAIRGDRIVFVGDARKAGLNAARTIDATGMIVAPGFIDSHTHTIEDLSDATRKTNEPYLMQGVTTVVTGNDGGSPSNIGETLSKWDQQGIGTNAALLAGFGTVRRRVLGSTDAQPTSEQLEEMKKLIAQAMDDGAFGMSTGLYYAPQSYAKTEEVIELAKVAATKGGIYDTHMRDEGSYTIGLLGAISETIRIGREAHIPVHISHIKALGPDVWGQSKQAIDLMKKARRAGIDATGLSVSIRSIGLEPDRVVGATLGLRLTGQSRLLQSIDDAGNPAASDC